MTADYYEDSLALLVKRLRADGFFEAALHVEAARFELEDE